MADAALGREPVTAEWLAAMIRNWVKDDPVLAESKAIVVQPPGDMLTVVVLQRGCNHLMIQVNPADLVIS